MISTAANASNVMLLALAEYCELKFCKINDTICANLKDSCKI